MKPMLQEIAPLIIELNEIRSANPVMKMAKLDGAMGKLSHALLLMADRIDQATPYLDEGGQT